MSVQTAKEMNIQSAKLARDAGDPDWRRFLVDEPNWSGWKSFWSDIADELNSLHNNGLNWDVIEILMKSNPLR